MRVTLFPHSTTPGGLVRTMAVEIVRRDDALILTFMLEGEVGRIAWPDPVEPRREDDLWRHTCFEAFIAADEGYVEYNLSPSGAWATYRFDSYRAGLRPADQIGEVVSFGADETRAQLEARIVVPHGAERLALSAVIETGDGTKSYWALAHPSDKPDFHHPDSFVLDLP